MTEVLLIAGPAGVGKSSVAIEISLKLHRAEVDHALIDTDELDRIYPVPGDLPRLTERNLAAVWDGFAERGAQRLILVGVHLDRPTEREWIARAVPAGHVTCVRLQASDRSLRARILRREQGSGAEAQWLRTQHQVGMARDLEADVEVIETDGIPIAEAARRILDRWPASPGSLAEQTGSSGS